METVVKKIDGLTFHITTFAGRKAINIERQMIALFSPVLSVLEKSNLKNIKDLISSNLNFKELSSSIKDIMLSMNEDEYLEFVKLVLSSTAVEYKKDEQYQSGKSVKKRKISVVEDLAKDEIIDVIFAGKTMVLYKLIFEIMKVNNLVFFGLMGGGKSRPINI